MRIAELQAEPNWVLFIVADDGRIGRFDVSPYLQYEAFGALRDEAEFAKVINGGVFCRMGLRRRLVSGHD